MIARLRDKFITLTSDQRFSAVLTGSAYALAARLAATGLTLVATIIVARVYGAGAVGILAVVNSALLLASVFTVLGTNSAILRLIPEHLARHSATSAFLVYRKTQYFVAAISAATGTALYYASDFVAQRVFSKPPLARFLALAAGFVIFKSIMDLNTQAVRGLQLNRTYALMQILPALTMTVGLVACTLVSRHPDTPVFSSSRPSASPPRRER